MGIWEFLTAGTKHKGHHAAQGQRGKHSKTPPPPAKNPAKSKSSKQTKKKG